MPLTLPETLYLETLASGFMTKYCKLILSFSLHCFQVDVSTQPVSIDQT